MNWRVVFVGLIGLVLMCGCAAEPQHLSWSEQLAFLQARAHREDPDAVLRRCYTHVARDPYTSSLDLNDLHRLDIDCEWFVPLGRYIQIDYVDDALSQTMNVEGATTYGGYNDIADIRACTGHDTTWTTRGISSSATSQSTIPGHRRRDYEYWFVAMDGL